jgi:ATP-binding cassette subfamily F protein uup
MEEIGGTSGMVRFGTQMLTVRSYLRRFLFDESRVNERVDKLSGGERARLMLAKTLCRGGNVIVLDEPTNDLDLSSLRMLEEALAVFDGTVLVVSHDRYFLDRICDQIIAFESGGIHIQSGNYSYYLDKKKHREQHGKNLARTFDVPASKPVVVPAPIGRKLTYKEKSELEGMERTILEAEQAAVVLEDLLNDPKFQIERASEAPAILAKLQSARSEIERLYARWEELSTL